MSQLKFRVTKVGAGSSLYGHSVTNVFCDADSTVLYGGSVKYMASSIKGYT